MGTIRAEPASGREVEVTSRKHAEDGDVDEVRIEVVQEGGDVTICAVYPGRGNSCEPGGGENHIRGHNDVHVDFTVRVPAGVNFNGAAVSGDVSATGLTGTVDLTSVSGNVSGTGLGGPADLNSLSGDLTISLPRDLGADVEMTTVSGDLSSDFPLTLGGRVRPRNMRARIGDGGRRLTLSTVSGDVRIRALQ